MRVPVPSDLSSNELAAAANSSAGSPAETFVIFPEGEAAGYLDMDLRPDKRYLYWTMPGNYTQADGKVIIARGCC